MMKHARPKSNARFTPYGAGVSNPYMPKAPGSAAEWLGQAPQQVQGGYYEVEPGMYQFQQPVPSMPMPVPVPGMPGMYHYPTAPVAPAAPVKPATPEIPVSITSVPKMVAGKIAADARNNQLTPLVARGKDAVNRAVKAIAMAESFLQKDNISLSCSPYHKNDKDASHGGRSVVFYLQKKDITVPKSATTVLNISKTGLPAKIAGSIAAKTRQHETIAMQGIGPDAVSIGVDAFVNARRFLKAGKSPLDINFTPKFVTATFGDKQSSSMYFVIEAVSRT